MEDWNENQQENLGHGVGGGEHKSCWSGEVSE